MAGLNPIQPFEPPNADPHWNDVLWLLKGEGRSGGFNEQIIDSSSRNWTLNLIGTQNFTYAPQYPSAAQGSHSPFNDPTTGSFQSGFSTVYWTPANGDLNDFVFNKDYTIECWIKPSIPDFGYPTSGRGLTFAIFGHRFVNGDDNYGTSLGIDDNGSIHWSWFDNSPWTATSKQKWWPGFLTDSDKFNWVHVAVSRKNNIVSIFKNGQLFTSWYDRGTVQFDPLLIGGVTSNTSLRYGQTIISYDYLPGGWVSLNGSNPAVYFDGAGDYFSHTNSAPNFAINDFTAEGYFSVDWDAPPNACLFTTSSSSSQKISVHVGSGVIRVFSGSTTTSQASPRISYPIAQNTWYHFALVRSGITLLLFLNGTLVSSWGGTAADSFPTTTTIALRLGLLSTVSTDNFKGHMCGFRVVNGAALYLSNFIPPTSPPQAIAGTQYLLNISPTIIGTTAEAPLVFGVAGMSSGSIIRGYITNLRVVNGTCVYNSNFDVSSSELEDVENTVLLVRCDNYDLIDSTNKFNVAIRSGEANTTPAPNDSPYLCISSATSKFGNSSIFFNCVSGTTPILPDNNFIYPGGYERSNNQDPFALGVGAFTIDFWIYPTVAVNRNCIIYDYSVNTAAYSDFVIYMNMLTMKPIVNIQGFLGQSETTTTISNNKFTGTCPIALPYNTWTHVALIRDSSGLNYNWVINGASAGISYPTGFLGSANSQIVRNIAKNGTFRWNTSNPPYVTIGGSRNIDNPNLSSQSGLIGTYLDEFRVTRNVVRNFSPVANEAQEINTSPILLSYTNPLMQANADYQPSAEPVIFSNPVITGGKLSDNNLFNINKTSKYEKIDWS